MTLNDTILICSLRKAAEKAKITGILNVKEIAWYSLLSKYNDYTKHKPSYKALNLFIKQQMSNLKYADNSIVNIKSTLPNTLITDSASIVLPAAPTPVLSNFTVSSAKAIIANTLYDAYTFNLNTILDNYTDADDEEFFQFQISLTDLADGSLYINGVSYGESAGDKITVLASDVDEITYYTSSSTTNTHALTVNVIDKDQYNRLTLSSPSTITVDRTLQTSAGNQPATIGDSAIYVANQIPTILTLAMFTTGLQPPYNDPEADLIHLGTSLRRLLIAFYPPFVTTS